MVDPHCRFIFQLHSCFLSLLPATNLLTRNCAPQQPLTLVAIQFSTHFTKPLLILYLPSFVIRMLWTPSFVKVKVSKIYCFAPPAKSFYHGIISAYPGTISS